LLFLLLFGPIKLCVTDVLIQCTCIDSNNITRLIKDGAELA